MYIEAISTRVPCSFVPNTDIIITIIIIVFTIIIIIFLPFFSVHSSFEHRPEKNKICKQTFEIKIDITNDNAKYLKTLFKTIEVLIPPIVDDRPTRAEQRSPYALQLNVTVQNELKHNL